MSAITPRVRVGITMGDPSGIGPEIIAKSLAKISGLAECVVIGDKRVFDKACGAKRMDTHCTFVDLANVSPKYFAWGKVAAAYGKASIAYLDTAVQLWHEGSIDCIVTCPISKESIHKAGCMYTGHTEYFARRFNCSHTVMMLLNHALRISLVTRHIPLEDVPAHLTPQAISSTIEISESFLRKGFGITRPKIVVCGLNPHASDNGVIGKQEVRLIGPLVRRLKKKFPGLEGVLPADVALGKASLGEYDCAIAMYHDQALIALKVSGDKSGVNLTLGLPLVRTSPLHGTAFDIAGCNKASPASFISAVTCAISCAKNHPRW